ncbi:MAG: hypothetical protein JNK56_16540, partial [Myxococcales bacterium]|nr:hypothetical protein [Myxococcales bacterium]
MSPTLFSLALLSAPDATTPPAEPGEAPVTVQSRYGVGLPPAASGSSSVGAATRTPDPPPAAKSEPDAGWRLNPPGRWYALRATAELGFVGVMKHGIQFGQQGSYFDFRNQGGQDVLFPFFRFTGEFAIKERHSLIFLIQPLKLKSTATLDRDLQVDGTRFAAGTPMAFKYDFGFYRFGYMYDLLKDPEQELGIG